MDLNKKTALLKQYLPQVAPDGLIEGQGAALESMGMPDAQTEAAVTGVQQLAVGETLEAAQANALEAIIHKQFRPAVFVIQDSYDVPPAPWESLASSDNRERISRAIRSIGRIELPGMMTIPFGGTGFVVGSKLVMTNRHVAEIFARGLGQQQLAFKPNRHSAVNFRREILPSPEVTNLVVQKVLMIHPYWDMALLQVEGLSAGQSPLTLSTTHPDDLVGRDIVIIGYPAQDPRNELELQNQIFGGVFDVKRLQPGFVRERRQILSFQNTVNALTHDASTLGGNSGSAVVDVQTGEVLALHFAGLYLDANFAVPGFELARDSRVVEAGVHFGPAVESTSDWSDSWRRADDPLELKHKTVVGGGPVASPQATVPQSSPNSVSFTIPLNVTITFGDSTAGLTPDVKLAVSSGPATMEGLFGDSDAVIAARAYERFSVSSLGYRGFSWVTAVSAAAASHLAYSDASRVTSVCQTWGFTSCDFIQTNGTECFVAATNDIVLLAFRGRAGVRDWIRDLTLFSIEVDYGSVHQGFYFGLQQVKAQIETVLDRVGGKDKNLVLTGHSLGGALATIAAAEFDDRYSVQAVYSYGQPAVGKRNFRDSMQPLETRFFRIVNDDDIVTMVPPGYVHVGKLYRFGFFGDVSHESAFVPVPAEVEMISEPEFRALQEQCTKVPLLNSQTPITEGLLPGPSFLDHKIVRYMDKSIKQLG